MSSSSSQLNLSTHPPSFCEYAGGACDQSFDNLNRIDGLFLYPSTPVIIASTIEEAVLQLRAAANSKRWQTWKDLSISGQIIFCEICKAMRFTRLVIADVTTMNFNLLFEIGFAIGLGIPVLPVRDSSFIKDAKIFNELGLIDTLGYFDFQNSTDIVKELLGSGRQSQLFPTLQPVDKERPIYLMKSPTQSEGMVRLMSSVKKSGLRFRSTHENTHGFLYMKLSNKLHLPSA